MNVCSISYYSSCSLSSLATSPPGTAVQSCQVLVLAACLGVWFYLLSWGGNAFLAALAHHRGRVWCPSLLYPSVGKEALLTTSAHHQGRVGNLSPAKSVIRISHEARTVHLQPLCSAANVLFRHPSPVPSAERAAPGAARDRLGERRSPRVAPFPLPLAVGERKGAGER